MVVSGPHLPLHDPEASWKALLSHGLEAQARHMEQTMSQISQVTGEMGQPGVERSICLQVMRELAHMVMRDAEGLVAFLHLAETMILSQPPLPSPAPPGEEAGRIEPVGEVPPAERPPEADEPEADPLQTWRDASDSEFISHLKAWMEEANVSQDELCRVLDYKPVYVNRVMRGTDAPTGRFRKRLLAYVASRGDGQPGPS
jgi:hypothetical protein